MQAAQSVPTPKKAQPDYFIIGWMTVIHLFALLAIFNFTWTGLFTALAMNFVTGCLGITFCFHRLLSHRSFKAHPLVEGFTAVCGTLALQGTAKEWVTHHRLHHRASDTERDPHNAREGFWHSHMGWMLRKLDPRKEQELFDKYAQDILAKPWLAFLSKPLVMIGLQIGLGLIFMAIGGASLVYWGIFFRLALTYHSTWFVNSATHKWGYRNFETDDLSLNSWWVAILTWGEGWHNNHHRYPYVAPARYRWWEVDVTYLIIKALSWVGLTWDIRQYPVMREAHSAKVRPLPQSLS